MLWKNGEQYDDNTAGQAMLHVMTRSPEELDTLDDEGCLRLAAAVVRQAMEDWSLATQYPSDPAALRVRQETEAFFYSGYCYLLTGVRGRRLMRMIKREMMEE